MPRGQYKRKPKQEPEFRYPVSIETERQLVGAALHGTEELFSELEPDDFYEEASKAAYMAARQLFEEGLAVTPVLVHERSGRPLADLDVLFEEAQGITDKELHSLIAELHRVSELRHLSMACKAATERAGKDAPVEEILQELESAIYGFAKDKGTDSKDAALVMTGVIQSFKDRLVSGVPAGISTGIPELDKAIIGLMPGKVYIIAGRPSMGKTALSGTCRRAVLKQCCPVTGRPYGVIDFNLEMQADELTERELATAAQVNLRKILSAKGVDAEEVQRIQDQDGSIPKERWWIEDSLYNITAIRRRAKILKARMERSGIKLGLVTIDYIQLCGDNGDGREQTVAAISRNIKLMAKELGCPVIALSQLNRACEARDDRRPMMSDLRESGAIEQDADLVCFVYREHIYDATHPPEDAELIIRKQRNGPIGTVRCRYNPKMVSFESNGPTANQPVDTGIGPEVSGQGL